jgi:diadenosine tetraphosphatase ApaH/serine/threonine PP2A family protein phosphatase
MNLNTQFVFDGKLKRNLIIGMALGCCMPLVISCRRRRVPYPFLDQLPAQHRVFHGYCFHGHVLPLRPDHRFWRLDCNGKTYMGSYEPIHVGWACVCYWWLPPVYGGICNQLYHWNDSRPHRSESPLYDRNDCRKIGIPESDVLHHRHVIGFLGSGIFGHTKCARFL